MTPLSLLAALGLAHSCAGTVAPETLLSVVQAESAFDTASIGVNSRPHVTLHPAGRAEAVAQARALIATGHDIDLGLAQINVRNLRRLGLSLEDAFDPCLNMRAGADLLTTNFRQALQRRKDPQNALSQALSAYNTGDPERGLTNGYVARVRQAAAVIVPALDAFSPTPTHDAGPRLRPDAVRLRAVPTPHRESALPRSTGSFDVFAAGRPAPSVWSTDQAPSPNPLPLVPPGDLP